jgi:2'-5' RNA ligase
VNSKRLFVAIDLSASIREALASLNPELPGVSWTPPEQMHLTLGFFGNVAAESENRLRSELSAIQFGAFFLPVRGIGTFPPKGAPKIIWIGVGTAHPRLFQIHKRVQEAALAARIEPDLRAWHPHITLARCRNVALQPMQKFLKKNAHLDVGPIRVEDFQLYSSKLTPAGSVYTRELSVSAER